MKKIFITLLLILSPTVYAADITLVPQDQGFLSTIVSKIENCTFHISCYFSHPLGSAITTINGTDRITDSRSVINTNFSNLNSTKIENSTTSMTQLVAVGTLTTGVWQATTIGGGYGGTGTTSPSLNQLLLGNISSGVKTVNGYGTSGQFLQSAGAGNPPAWTSASIDLTANNVWTSASTTFVNGVSIGTGTTTYSTSTALYVSNSATIVSLGVGSGVATSTASSTEIGGDLFVRGHISSRGGYNILATSTIFTTSGTWIKPASVTSVRVVVIGGGGGGGATTASANGSGGGGASGCVAYGDIAVSGNVTVTVGDKGTGGTAGNNDATAGGNTSFAGVTTISANGGAAGNRGAGSDATGGSACSTTSGGLLAVNGQRGQDGETLGGVSFGGGGGSSPYGQGAYKTLTNTAGEASTGYGSGGAGASSEDGTARAGGNGTIGAVIIQWFQ